MGDERSEALVSRLLGRRVHGVRAIVADQTNRSVVVGEVAVVKWLRVPVPEPHPGVEVLRRLDAAGFVDMPRLLGVDVEGGAVTAVVTEYVTGAVDGWDWYVDDVDAWLHGAVPSADIVGWAQRMGEITVSMHTALASMEPCLVERTVYGRLAAARVERALADLDTHDATAAAELRSMQAAVEAALAPLRVPGALPAHRIHGDLHAGQFLRADGRLLLTDFDGNPLDGDAIRRTAQSPLVDLAALVQSIDHVGRIVVHRRHPDRASEVDGIVAAATAAAIAAYEDHHTVDHDVLFALRVAQEVHEFDYAATHLPRWMYVPRAALPALLGKTARP